MPIIYKISNRPSIEKVSVIKNNAKTVLVEIHGLDGEFIGGAREKKEGVYFETFIEAKLYLYRVAKDRLVADRLSLQLSQDFYGNVKGLRDEG